MEQVSQGITRCQRAQEMALILGQSYLANSQTASYSESMQGNCPVVYMSYYFLSLMILCSSSQDIRGFSTEILCMLKTSS